MCLKVDPGSRREPCIACLHPCVVHYCSASPLDTSYKNNNRVASPGTNASSRAVCSCWIVLATSGKALMHNNPVGVLRVRPVSASPTCRSHRPFRLPSERTLWGASERDDIYEGRFSPSLPQTRVLIFFQINMI